VVEMFCKASESDRWNDPRRDLYAGGRCTLLLLPTGVDGVDGMNGFAHSGQCQFAAYKVGRTFRHNF
jgi:hypothetical protein